MSCSPIYFGGIDLAKSLATAALASRTARPSSPVSDSTELAISAHMRWRLGSLAFLVWRSASSEFHGIGLTSGYQLPSSDRVANAFGIGGIADMTDCGCLLSRSLLGV